MGVSTSYEKLSKKEKKKVDREKRNTWDINPQTKVVGNKKGKGSYSRHPKHRKSEED
jgi:hypothetical protein